MNATDKQRQYIERLLEQHEAAGTLEDVIAEIDPDLGEYEDFNHWIARQSVKRASEVIDFLKDAR